MSQDVEVKIEEEEDQDVKIKIEVVDLDADPLSEGFPEEGRKKWEPRDMKDRKAKAISTTAKSKGRRPPTPTSAKEKAASARRAKERRANETPEQRKARLDKLSRNYRRRMARETPEETKARRDMENERQRSRRGTHPSPQELEEALIDPADNELREEVKQILIERRDKWKQRRVTWEEAPNGQLLMTRAKMLTVKKNYQQFLAEQKRREAMSEEELAREKQLKASRSTARWAHLTEDQKRQHRISNYFGRLAWKASLSAEEREQQAQKQREKNKRTFQNWTEEQKQRHRENCTRNSKRLHQRYKEKYREYYLEKRKSQTPEQRQRTLLGYRISQAKRLLKKKLEKGGVATPEEIQEQVKELVRKMQSEPLPPLEKVSEYKPRPSRRQCSEGVLTKTVNVLSLPQLSVEPPRPIPASVLSSESQSGLLIRQTSSILGGQEVEMDKDLNGDDFDEEDPSIPSPGPASPAPSPQPELTLDTNTIGYQNCHDLIELEEHDFSDSAMDIIGDIKGQLDIGHDKNLTSASPPMINSEVAIVEPVRAAAPPPPPENKCPHCPHSFPQLPGMHSHIRSIHPEKCWKCPKCSTLSPSPQQFSEHYKSHHQSKSMSTSVVEVEVKEEDIEGAPKPRNSCESRSRRPGRRRKAAHECQHRQLIKTKTFPFTCMKCPVQSRRRSCSKTSQFETHEELTAHVRVSHPKDFFPCSQCKLLKYNQASLKIHLKICRRKLKS